jgi:hypothetical protein
MATAALGFVLGVLVAHIVHRVARAVEQRKMRALADRNRRIVRRSIGPAPEEPKR